MTDAVKYFIEDNYGLIETDLFAFLMHARDELTIREQAELMDVLHTIDVDTDKTVDAILNYIITMLMDTQTRSVSVLTFIDRYLYGILGCDESYLHSYILENSSEWNVSVEVNQSGDYVIIPQN